MYVHLKVARSLWPYSHKVMIRKRASLKKRYDTVMITASGRELDPFPITGKVPIPAVTESSGSPEFSVTEIDGQPFPWRCSAGWAVLGFVWVVWCIGGCIAVALRRWESGYNGILVVVVDRPGCVHGVRSALPPAVRGWVGGSMATLDLFARCWSRCSPAEAAGSRSQEKLSSH